MRIRRKVFATTGQALEKKIQSLMKNENLTRKDAIEHIEFRDRLAKELALKRREINSTRALSEEAAKKLEGTGLLAEKMEKGAQNFRRVRALGEVHIDEAAHLGELRRKKTNIITEAGKRQAARNDKLAKLKIAVHKAKKAIKNNPKTAAGIIGGSVLAGGLVGYGIHKKSKEKSNESEEKKTLQ